ncbi:MAG: C4-dicarboxylate ABC transporter substrate-binding protein [Alphaproteobacteria bacterium]|nr:C4-dicarboxylate ABC transporter substrate-binding protein [Alphaproteobacteria bacterium]|tara:strand:+ start:3624 stop:4127 length:504 start_codon:yes stop_codon:yes gene_type:complete
MIKFLFYTSNKLLLSCCIISLTALVLITVVDVFGRYLLGIPLPGTSEITEIILGILIYIGLPYISKKEEHISVSLLSNYLPNNVKILHKILINFIVTLLLLVIARQLYLHGIDLKSYQEVTTFLEIPKAPIAFAMALLTVLASFNTIMNMFSYMFKERDITSDKQSI